MDIARKAGDTFFNPETRLCVISRDTAWYALALLFDDQEERRELGRDLLGSLHCEDATHTPATLLAMYYNIPDLLTPDLKRFFRRTIESRLIEATDVRWKDGNVNHPLAA